MNKVKNYKQQDMKAKREKDSDEYIDESWLMNLINTNCECCSCVLYIDYDGKKCSIQHQRSKV